MRLDTYVLVRAYWMVRKKSLSWLFMQN